MLTRQQFFYTDANGQRKGFLLMPNEHAECLHYMRELGWSVAQCFERQTGKLDATDIVLRQEILDKPTNEDK